MLESCNLALEEFSVSLEKGFLPSDLPIQRLPDAYYEPWEALMQDLPSLVRRGEVRERVLRLPILTAEKFVGEAQWRRAYSILSYLAHAFIWGGTHPEDTLPPAISCPYLAVSLRLGLPPCATYAALNLWNYSPINSSDDLADPDNISILNSMTGTDDERWFLVISVAIEARGAIVIPMMLNAIDAVNRLDHEHVTQFLSEIAACIIELGRILARMHEKCNPDVFYHQIRPLLAGSKNMADAGLPRGVFYDQGQGIGQWYQLSGGSNAQSSLIQLLDIFFGVVHSATESGKSSFGESKEGGQHPFMQEMRNYMPPPHRRFLEHLTQIANVRSFAMNFPAESSVRQAYNTAVMALGSFRDKHIQIVSRYIITPARNLRRKKEQAASTLAVLMSSQSPEKVQVNLATASSRRSCDQPESLRGTGGTALVPFLKHTRDETKAAGNFE